MFWGHCQDHFSPLGHMDSLRNLHCHLLLFTRLCGDPAEGIAGENVRIFSLNNGVEGETAHQDGAHRKREGLPRGLNRSELSNVVGKNSGRPSPQCGSQACEEAEDLGGSDRVGRVFPLRRASELDGSLPGGS